MAPNTKKKETTNVVWKCTAFNAFSAIANGSFEAREGVLWEARGSLCDGKRKRASKRASKRCVIGEFLVGRGPRCAEVDVPHGDPSTLVDRNKGQSS